MHYKRIDDDLIEIIPEEPVLNLLRVIARKSYETAISRGRTGLGPLDLLLN